MRWTRWYYSRVSYIFLLFLCILNVEQYFLKFYLFYSDTLSLFIGACVISILCFEVSGLFILDGKMINRLRTCWVCIEEKKTMRVEEVQVKKT